MLQVDPSKRITAEKILKDNWICNSENIALKAKTEKD